MVFSNAIFAGGGSRCFWQLGFWEGAQAEGLDLHGSVDFVGSTSAGCAMATAVVLDRSLDALDLFKRLTADNPRNIHWHNLAPFRRDPVLPHDRMYRQALREFVGTEELRALQEKTVHFLMSARPDWLRGPWATALGMSAYVLERKLHNPLNPSWPAKLGFTPVVGSPRDCDHPEQFVELVLAASCVPPLLPAGRFGDTDVLDGGLVEHIPVRLADGRPGKTLVLLSRPYDATLPTAPDVAWAQPSRPIGIDKFDYANPDGLQQTFDLGLEDGRKFVSAMA